MSNFKPAIAAIAVIAAVSVGSFPARAAPVSITGADNDVTSLADMINSQIAQTAFIAATVAGHSLLSPIITFEDSLPAGVAISGGGGGSGITNDSGCGLLCGINTTPSGAFFYLTVGGTATFTFTKPIDAFGMYVTGLQTDLVAQETLTYDDGSTQTINTPTATGGGGAFIGFTDFGKNIVSISYNATTDIVALDDVLFEQTIPEPASLVILGSALLGFGMIRRRRNGV